MKKKEFSSLFSYCIESQQLNLFLFFCPTQGHCCVTLLTLLLKSLFCLVNALKATFECHTRRPLCGSCEALKNSSSIIISHIFGYLRGAISRHTQMKFCVFPEFIHIFHFPDDCKETICFYWAGITPAEP